MTTMDWIKKNWMTIAVVALVIAAMVYLINKYRESKGESALKPLKIPKLTRSSTVALTPAQEAASLADLKKKLADCELQMTSVRLASGGINPCATLRDMVAKASGESSFTGAFSKTPGLNVLDFGMGLDGMALLEDKNLRAGGESGFQAVKPKMCHYPDGTPVPCSVMEEIRSVPSPKANKPWSWAK